VNTTVRQRIPVINSSVTKHKLQAIYSLLVLLTNCLECPLVLLLFQPLLLQFQGYRHFRRVGFEHTICVQSYS